MTKAQMKALRPGDQIRWKDTHTGATTKYATGYGILIEYANGQTQVLSYKSARRIEPTPRSQAA